MGRKLARYGQPAIYNLSPVTYADGESAGLQVDVNGFLKISGVVSGSSTSNGTYNSTAPTIADAGTGSLQVDVNGNLKETMASRLDALNDAVTAYPFGHSYINIATATTTQVKTGAGVVHSIYIANPGATGNTVKVYDNTAASGTVLLDLSTAGGVPVQGTIALNAAFATGLCVVTAGTTPPNITVIYR